MVLKEPGTRAYLSRGTFHTMWIKQRCVLRTKDPLLILLVWKGLLSPSVFFWQFPRLEALVHDLETWKAIMLWPNCSAVGLSLVPPADLCFEKYISSGSWLKRSLSKYSTPGIRRRTLPNFVKEFTEIKRNVDDMLKQTRFRSIGSKSAIWIVGCCCEQFMYTILSSSMLSSSNQICGNTNKYIASASHIQLASVLWTILYWILWVSKKNCLVASLCFSKFPG